MSRVLEVFETTSEYSSGNKDPPSHHNQDLRPHQSQYPRRLDQKSRLGKGVKYLSDQSVDHLSNTYQIKVQNTDMQDISFLLTGMGLGVKINSNQLNDGTAVFFIRKFQARFDITHHGPQKMASFLGREAWNLRLRVLILKNHFCFAHTLWSYRQLGCTQAGEGLNIEAWPSPR